MLDEPTAGMDLGARRDLWNMLKNYRRDKIMILTTHYMDEAEYCGRVSIMVDGRIEALDTPEKLKEYVEIAVDGYYQKTSIPFIIYDKRMRAYAGSTRFGMINYKNKVLHIGWTWIGREFQGTGLNVNVKFLMLQL